MNVDHPPKISHVGLCAGYGGIELGLQRCIPALRTVALCEIEAFAIANLVAKMETGLLDPAPVWSDVTTFPWSAFHGKVDILSGGYPCQPFSSAGKRLGANDPRHLWPHIATGIAAMRPRLCFFENVEGHVTLGLRDVLTDLVKLGYRVEDSRQEPTFGIFSASECGAPHQRKRVFIVAYDQCQRVQELCRQISNEQKLPAIGHNGRDAVADSNKSGRSFGRDVSGVGRQQKQDAWPSRPGEPQHDWEPPRVVADTKYLSRCSQRRIEPRWRKTTGPEQKPMPWRNGEVVNTAEPGPPLRSSRPQERPEPKQEPQRPNDDSQRKTKSALGRNADGSPNRLDVTGNRIDELRLLGNGVVPATAALAFRTLTKNIL